MDRRLDRFIKEIYYNVADPASFSSADALLTAVRRRFPRVKRERIEKFLARQNAYTMHRKALRRFPRRKTYGDGWRSDLQIDLADLQNVAEFNVTADGLPMKYLLTAICCFSRFAWAVPVPDKRPTSVVEALKSIFDGFLPLRVYSDAGGEFRGAVDTFFKKNEINHIVLQTDLKCALVERLNRTIKSKLYKIFTFRWLTRPFHYLDVLPAVMHSINHRVNRTVGRTPASIGPFTSLHLLPTRSKKAKFAVGDKVRTTRHRAVFDKGYTPAYTTEYFVVHRVRPTQPTTYQLRDLKGEDLKGAYYGAEMVRVDPQPDDLYKVEELRRRIVRGQRQVLVHYWGWPDKFNEWIPADNMQAVRRRQH